MLKRLLSFSLVLTIVISWGQVTPDINSGNPNFPFPQFLGYDNGQTILGNLGTDNSPGVPHAEMEKRMKEAWLLVCNNTSPYPGAVVSGVQYLQPTAPNHCTCVEGDGYYLLGAAMMGDKTFFDGYYMWAHDRAFNGVKRFIDGVDNPYGNYARGLSYAGGFGSGTGVNGGGISGNSATDGDVDVALALLMAYKQWGENSGIILNDNGWGGKEINYKEEALKYIEAMVDTALFPLALPIEKYTSGVVGLDGYLKGGDSQGELTDWAVNGGYLGMSTQVGQQDYHFDYSAPAWFHQFARFLEDEGSNPFYIDQYDRVEASCDWLIHEHHLDSPNNVPYMGDVTWEGGNEFSFHNYIVDGEDFRTPWRTVMNYVWHGNPETTWNPTSHQPEPGQNTFEYDVGLRYATFLKNSQASPWNNACADIGDMGLSFFGPYTLLNGYDPAGNALGAFPLNWIHGCGAPSAIAAQDYNLMGEMFRHCVIAWDAATGQNLDSRPIYFHEWFRLAGMLSLSGNFHAPDKMVPKANLKVYHKVDKTFAFTGDEVTFNISYRNYGSVDATGSTIKFGIPDGFDFVSATDGGAVSGDSVIWNIGLIPGFETGGLAATIDSMEVTLRIGNSASGRYCTSARIFSDDGFGWTSNEYPNNITAVMERNCVDVVKRALRIDKVADREQYNPGQDIKYKIVFENSSDAGWINGGRPGVRFSFAHDGVATPASSGQTALKYRLFHDAEEAYIDYGNYRVSYFMNDPSITCYVGDAGCGVGWDIQNTIGEGVDPAAVNVSHETITPGTDVNGSWNQRIILQFSPQLATVTQHLQQYAGSPDKVHEGGLVALRGVWRLFTSNYTNVDWTDDWSWDATKSDADGGIYYPVGDDYTDPDNLGLPIDSWHKSACETTSEIMKKVLVEEWDGYVWRRVYGNGPLPGRDVENVIVTDTLPVGMTFKNFIRQNALGIDATTRTIAGGRTVIEWSIPKMQINQKDSILFTATVDGSCPGSEGELVNGAWISGDSESAIVSIDTVTVTCIPVAVCPEQTTMIKSSDKPSYSVGETVQYSIDYTQTIGTITNPDLNNDTDWTAQNGTKSIASFNAGTITIPQINGGGNLVLTHDYSYGVNTLGEGIQGTIQITSYAKAAIVVRHGGGTYANGVFIEIKPANPATEIRVLNGTTPVGSTTVPYTTPASIDFKIVLQGDRLDLWLAPTPASFSGAPAYSVTGITEQIGWAGIARGNTMGDPSGTGVLTSWNTHLDAAFNVQVNDPVPTGIINPSSFSNSGYNDTGIIRWDLVSGKGASNAMLYGTSTTLTWEGIYDQCDNITNIAYVNSLGVSGDVYGDCYEISCGSTPVCTSPGTASITMTPLSGEECDGNTVTLAAGATGTPPTGGWEYEFFEGTNSQGTASGTATLNASASGNYTVVITDPSDAATCNATSLPVTVTITTPPVITASGTDPSTCSGTDGAITIENLDPNTTYDVSYNTSETATITTGAAETTGDITGLDADTYTDISVTVNGCPSNTIGSVTLSNPSGETPTIVGNDPTTCSGTDGSIAISDLTANADYDLAYGGSPMGTVTMDNNGEYTITGLPAGSYSGVTLTRNGCSTTPEDVDLTDPSGETITLNTANDPTTCSGTDGSIVLSGLTASTTYDVNYNGSSQGTATTDGSGDLAIGGLAAGTYTDISVTLNGCQSNQIASQTLSDPSGETIAATLNNPTVCTGTDGSIVLSGLTANTIYDVSYNGSSQGTGTTDGSGDLTIGTLGSGSYTDISVTLNGCQSNILASETLSEPGAPAAPTVTGDVAACENGSVTLDITTPEATSTYNWTITSGAATFQGSGTTTSTGASVQVDASNDDVTIEVTETTASNCTSTTATHSITTTVVGAPTSITGSTTPDCQSSSSYTAVGASNATGYDWTVTAGDATPQTQSSAADNITVDFGSLNGDVQVVATNGSCQSTSVSVTIDLQNCDLMANASASEVEVCEGTAITFTNISTGGTDFTWDFGSVQSETTVGPHIITLPVGTHDITLTVSETGFTTDDTTFQVTVKARPATPIISGTTPVCEGTTGEAYAVTNPTSGATYAWTVSNGATDDGSTTENLSVDFPTGLVTSPVSIDVTADLDGCGATTPATPLAVTINQVPTNPSVITGAASICMNTPAADYSIDPIANSDSYEWVVPSNLSGTSTTNTINITPNALGTAELKVVAKNTCGDSDTSSLEVFVGGTPDQTGAAITQNTGDVCTGVTETYELRGVLGADTYAWTIPAEGTVSGPTDQSSIQVDWSTPGTYNVSVTPSSASCGAGTAEVFQVIVNTVPDQPQIAGATAVCASSQETYTADESASTITGDSFIWDITNNDALINGGFSFTSTALVDVQSSDFTINVVAVNGCGNSPQASASVTVENNVVPEATIFMPDDVCEDSTIQVQANIGAAGNNPTIQWFVNTVEELSQAGNNPATLTLNNNDQVSIQVTSDASCKDPLNDVANDQITISTVEEPVALAFTSSETEACEGAPVIFEIDPVTAATGYDWTAGGATLTEQTPTRVEVVFTTDETVSVIPTNVCYPTGGQGPSQLVTVNTQPADDGIMSGATDACTGNQENYAISAVTGATSYNWNVSSGTMVDNGDNIDVTFGTTDATIIVTAVNDCGTTEQTSRVNVAVTNVDLPVITITGSPAFCENTAEVYTVVETPSGAFSNPVYNWSGLTATSITNQITLDPAVEGAGAKNLEVSVTYDGGACGPLTATMAAPYTVQVDERPTGTITSESMELCEGDNLIITPTAGISTVTYSWQLNGQEVGTGATYQTNTPSTGTYTLVLDNQNGCPAQQATGQVDVTVYNKSDFSFVDGKGQLMGSDDQYKTFAGSQAEVKINLTSSNGVTVNMESNDNQLLEVSQQATSANYTSNVEGVYSVTASVGDPLDGNNLCTTSKTIEVKVLEGFSIPNAFSPNGDSQNDIWEIPALEAYPDAVVRVFNRWGREIYLKIGSYADQPWDGYQEGEPYPIGTYYFIIEVNDPEGVFTETLRGAVSVTK